MHSVYFPYALHQAKATSMARTVRNAKLDTRSARSRLTARREPYWTVISGGCALGYRRGANGGTWIGRFRDDKGRQHYEALGASDDARDPDGLSVFSFAQAQEKSRAFFARKARDMAGDAAPSEGPYRVTDALDDYFKSYAKRGKGVSAALSAANLHIRHALGAHPIAKLTTKRLRDWHHTIAEKPRQARGKRGGPPKDAKGRTTGRDVIRKRRATANRVLTVLKAALNHAWREGTVPTDEAWRRVSPFKAVDNPVIRYLSEEEVRRLVNACSVDFRDIVRGALLTGCRYGELIGLRVADYNSDTGTVTVRESKAGKVRHVVLTDEGRGVFEVLAAGRAHNVPLFLRVDGKPWGSSHQQRPLAEACAYARISPAVSFHILRHTYGSTLAMRGVPMGVIASQLGHADTRMTEKHYAHLAPSYVADTIRAHFPTLGIAGDAAVASISRRRK
jgi:integrase